MLYCITVSKQVTSYYRFHWLLTKIDETIVQTTINILLIFINHKTSPPFWPCRIIRTCKSDRVRFRWSTKTWNHCLIKCLHQIIKMHEKMLVKGREVISTQGCRKFIILLLWQWQGKYEHPNHTKFSRFPSVSALTPSEKLFLCGLKAF